MWCSTCSGTKLCWWWRKRLQQQQKQYQYSCIWMAGKNISKQVLLLFILPFDCEHAKRHYIRLVCMAHVSSAAPAEGTASVQIRTALDKYTKIRVFGYIRIIFIEQDRGAWNSQAVWQSVISRSLSSMEHLLTRELILPQSGVELSIYFGPQFCTYESIPISFLPPNHETVDDDALLSIWVVDRNSAKQKRNHIDQHSIHHKQTHTPTHTHHRQTN